MKKEIRIKINGEYDFAILEIEGDEISFFYKNERIVSKGEYPFLVLKDIREQLEIRNIFLMINGSRKDVHPSGMSAQGYKAYVTKVGKSTTLDDLVDIFESTNSPDQIGTVEEQLHYHKIWSASLLSK